MIQPLLVSVGTQQISDDQIGQIVQLAGFAFDTFKKIGSGGLLILHGLVVTVEERIQPHVEAMIGYLVHAIKM